VNDKHSQIADDNPKPPRTKEFLKEHAQTIRDFLVALFGEDEQVWIFPAITDEKFNSNKNLIPACLHGKSLTYSAKDSDEMKNRRFVLPFSRKSSSCGTQQVSKLWEFADLGYDIYFCINPLTTNKKCQRTVRQGVNILIESDTESLERQKEVLLQNKAIIRAALYTGSKSIHAYIHLTPPLWNPNQVGYKQAKGLKNKKCLFPDFVTTSDAIINRFESQDFKVDTGPARDWTRVSRLPGFPHGKTGKPSEVLWINPASSYDTDTIVKNKLFNLLMPDDSCTESSSQINSSISVHNKHFNDSLDLDSSKSPPELSVIPVKHVSEETTNNKAITKIVKHKGSYLDSLQAIEACLRHGITQRGTRRKLQYDLMVTGIIMGWDESRLMDVWKSILLTGEPSIGCSTDKAQREFESVLIKKTSPSIFKENMRTIPHVSPSLDKKRAQSLFYEFPAGKEEGKNILRLLSQVVLPKIRKLPLEVGTGRLNITAKEMLAACLRGKYRPALDWLIINNFVQITNEYTFKKRARAYWVNVPLVNYLMGFKTEDLDWSVPVRMSNSQSEEKFAA